MSEKLEPWQAMLAKAESEQRAELEKLLSPEGLRLMDEAEAELTDRILGIRPGV